MVSARTEPRAFAGAGVTQGDPVDTFKFIINKDTTGSTAQRNATGPCCHLAANYPNGLRLDVDQRGARRRPIVAQGDQDDLAALPALDDGKYLISVLADGYKLDGAHFAMPLDPGPGGGRAAADAAARLHGQGPGLRGHGAHQRRLRRRRPAPRGLPGPPQRPPRRGHHRRLRQPAVHDVRR